MMLSRKCDERQSTAGKALFYVTVEAESRFRERREDGSKHIVKTFSEDHGQRRQRPRTRTMSAAATNMHVCKRFRSQRGDNDADATITGRELNSGKASLSIQAGDVRRQGMSRAIAPSSPGVDCAINAIGDTAAQGPKEYYDARKKIGGAAGYERTSLPRSRPTTPGLAGTYRNGPGRSDRADTLEGLAEICATK